MDATAFRACWWDGRDAIMPVELLAQAVDPKGVALLNPEDSEFLQETGLPEEAAPFLTFEPDDLGWIPEHARPPEYDRYVGIGTNGSGDPLVACREGVFVLNHDDGFSPAFVNCSIASLAQTLLLFRDFVKELTSPSGDRPSPVQAKHILITHLETHDPKALLDGSMWPGEIDAFETGLQD